MKHFSLTLLGTLLLLACSTGQPESPTATKHPIVNADEATIYGLVCDGSNDTILIFLHDPYDGANPDTLNILAASKAQQVFGQLRTGDKVAIVRDTADDTRASQVIVTQDLQGQWCYKVKPQLRRTAGMAETGSEIALRQLPDSVRQLLDTELEYGLMLKSDSVAYPIAPRAASLADANESPVEYPSVKRYSQWHIRNGKLLLTEAVLDSLGNSIPQGTDTTELVRLTPDTLVLRFADGEKAYYRKTE